MKRIELKFEKSLIALAGNPYGRKTFEVQVKGGLSKDESQYCIVIPSHIKKMASSFVQGFFHYWLTTLGTDELRKQIIIETPYKELELSIWDNLK